MQTNPHRRRVDATESDTTPPGEVRVLLVDDDENFRTWLEHVVRKIGFQVEVAANGLEALESLRRDSFDLVISDFEMPLMDGFDLIRAIRSDDALMQQFAVMLTSHDDLDAKIAALTVGYDDFLSKACTEVEVIAKVVAARRVVSRQRQLVDAARTWEMRATRDELTGVATRRTMYERIEAFLAEGRSIGLAILDLDDFKLINDTWGHLTGDRILRDVGALFLGRTRSNDLVARYGGDEFLLLVPDATLEDLRGAAERLVTELGALRWQTRDASISISATSGIAHTSVIAGRTLEQLVDAADKDLYANKCTKKNAAPRTRRERRDEPVAQMEARPE